MKTLLRVLVFALLFSFTPKNSENKKSTTEDTAVVYEAEQNKTFVTKNEQETEESFLSEWTEPLRVYISDPDSLPTNVRDKPRGRVILKLPKTDEYEVYLTEETSGWFLVSAIEGINNETHFENVDGYIHGSILAASTRNYGGEKINLYSEPNQNSVVVHSFYSESELTLKGADDTGKMIKVRYSIDGHVFVGWIDRVWLCGSIRSNCS